MKYHTLEKFKETVGSDSVFTIHATLAPAIICVAWDESIEKPINCFFIAKGRDTYLSINETRYFARATDMFRRYYTGDISIPELETQYRTYEYTARKLYTELSHKDLTDATDAELEGYMQEVYQLYRGLLDTIYIETIDYDKILSVIGSEWKGRLDAVWEKATESTFVSFEGRYLRNMIDLASSEPHDAVREARFMFADYFGIKDIREIEIALEEIRSKTDEKTNEVLHIERLARERKDAFSAWLTTLSSEERRIVEYMQLMMYLRDVRKDPIAQMIVILIDVATAMTSRAGIDAKHVPFIILYEYMKGINHLKSIKDEVARRDQGCLYFAGLDCSYEIEHCDFETAVAQFSEWTKHHLHGTDELKGQTACRGKVSGVVRVVSDPHDDRGFEKGDVLVTSMTRPEFVPIMKMAGAVITNEGGITCHAAIVSRELRIPCIIGTKIATQVLKDGDLVEVDADNGVVRVLEKFN